MQESPTRELIGSGDQSLEKSTSPEYLNHPQTTSSYPKSRDEFDTRLERSSDILPAYLPMIVTKDYTHERVKDQTRVSFFKSPNSTSLANARISVKRGTLVSALYKQDSMILVITPQNTSGFIPHACLHPLGIKVETSDFSQQFPELTALHDDKSLHKDDDVDSLLNNSITSSVASVESYKLNNLDSLTLRKQSRLILTRMAIMRAQNQYSSPELSFCVNYSQGNKHPNIALLNQNETKHICGTENRKNTKKLRRTNSKSQTTQTYCKTYNKPLVSILKSPEKTITSTTKSCTLVDNPQCIGADENNNDMTVTISPWWTKTPTAVTSSDEEAPSSAYVQEQRTPSMRLKHTSKTCEQRLSCTSEINNRTTNLCTPNVHMASTCGRSHTCCTSCHVSPSEQIYENLSAIIASRCSQCNHNNDNHNHSKHNRTEAIHENKKPSVATPWTAPPVSLLPTVAPPPVTIPMSSYGSRASDTDSAISSMYGSKTTIKQAMLRRSFNGKNKPIRMTVLFDYEVSDDVTGQSHLFVRQNDIVTVLCDKQNDWLWVRCQSGKVGYIPKAYVVNLQGLQHSYDPHGKSTYL